MLKITLKSLLMQLFHHDAKYRNLDARWDFGIHFESSCVLQVTSFSLFFSYQVQALQLYRMNLNQIFIIKCSREVFIMKSCWNNVNLNFNCTSFCEIKILCCEVRSKVVWICDSRRGLGSSQWPLHTLILKLLFTLFAYIGRSE